jgi:hypothetical protein
MAGKGLPEGKRHPYAPKLLRDMRRVYRKPKEKGENESEGMKLCRRLYDDNPKDFMDRLMKMEKEWKEQLAKWRETGVIGGRVDKVSDEGSMRVNDLIAHLLGLAKNGLEPRSTEKPGREPVVQA